MVREPDADTPGARPPDEPRSPDDEVHRADALAPDEKHRIAREQGRLIASGRARKGHIVLRTPARRAVFIGGLIGIIVLVLVFSVFI